MKEDRIACFGLDHCRALYREFIRRNMMIAAKGRQRAALVAAGIDAQAPLFPRRVIEMEDHGDHAVVAVREIGIILVHRKGRALFRRLDEHLVVMQLDIGPDDIDRYADQPGIGQQPGEGGAAKMDVVAVGDGRSPILHTVPGRIGLPLLSIQRMDLCAIGSGLFRRQQIFDQNIALVGVPCFLLGCQAEHAASPHASQIAAVHEKSSPPLPVPSTGLNAS